MLKKHKTRVIFICTPNNPTGNVVKHNDLVEFLSHVPAHVLVVIDEAYIEFNRDKSAVDSLKIMQTYPNVGLLRTFSKAYGLAGLRVGYFIGPQPVAEAVRKTAVPFGVSHIAQVAAVESLNYKDELMQRVESIVQIREWFEEQLRTLGFDLVDSQANFVWLALGERTADFAAACDDIAVAVRPFAGLGVRISIGEKEALERVLQVARDFVIN
jgi:histidinol-phosphate aminotransferase